MNDILNIIFLNLTAVARGVSNECISNDRHRISFASGEVILTLEDDHPTIRLTGGVTKYLASFITRMTTIEIPSTDLKYDFAFVSKSTTINSDQSEAIAIFTMVNVARPAVA